MLSAAVATAASALTALPAAPAAATACDPVLGCIHAPHVGLPDVFGEVVGVPCQPTFAFAGREGDRIYWSGPIAGATYAHSDIQTKRMSVTCAVRTAGDFTSGEERGAETAYSVAPLTFTASATGLTLRFWSKDTSEQLFLCTTVHWTDRAGLTHTHRYDWNESASGDQCVPMVWVRLPV
jgi:hypothetical protein